MLMDLCHFTNFSDEWQVQFYHSTVIRILFAPGEKGSQPEVNYPLPGIEQCAEGTA
jgi:hypothetical protein